MYYILKAFKSFRRIESPSYRLVEPGEIYEDKLMFPTPAKMVMHAPELSLFGALGPSGTWTYAVGYFSIAEAISFLLFLLVG